MKYVAVNRDTRSFQLPLSDIQIQRLTQNAFGEMPLSWQLMTTGKFNTSYRIEFAHLPTCILRVAPSSDVVLFRHEKLLLRRENLVQQQLNKISDKVPVNLYADFSQELIARNYVFQNCLEGELWDAVKCDLTADQNDHLWRSLAPIVRAIHQLEGESFGSPLLKGNYQCWSDAVIDWVAGMVTDMQRYRLNSTDAQRFLELVILGRGLLDDVKRPTLVHGDLWQKNILITRHHGEVQISGILDAERAFWGEPLAEWIFSFLEIPPGFWGIYGALPKDHSAVFRKSVSEGRGALQLCLEAWRFNFDSGFAEKNLHQVIRKLERQLGLKKLEPAA